jgi:hypothetical protein
VLFDDLGAHHRRIETSSPEVAYAAADVEVLIELDARMRTALPLVGPEV